MKIATSVALILLVPLSGALTAFPQDTAKSITLTQVRRIYIPVEPPPGREKSPYWSNSDNVEFQKLLVQKLVRYERAPKNDPNGKKWKWEGDCKEGFETVIAELKMVCGEQDADAELLGYAADVSAEVTTDKNRTNLRFAGGASLTDVRTGGNIWRTQQGDQSTAMALLAPNARGSLMDVAGRIISQLKKDVKRLQQAPSKPDPSGSCFPR